MKISALTLVCIAGAVWAQQPASPPDSRPKSLGQVAGIVVCRDTGRPGRFASVELLTEQGPRGPAFDPAGLAGSSDLSKLTTTEISAAMSTAMRNMMRGSNLSTLAGLDGRFALEKVPAGTYYVIVQLDGYRSPLSGLPPIKRFIPDSETLAAVKSEAQRIVVRAGETTSIRVQLDRGAALSGTVTYSDGSPALGVVPVLLRRGWDGRWTEITPTALGLTGKTDDRGAFRFSGLPAGQYAVQATLPTTQALSGLGLGQSSLHMDTGDALVVYSGGAMRESDITPIDLTDGGSRTGISIVFPLEGLHTLSGSVVARSDHHPVNAGMIELQDPQTKESLRTAILGEDGTFRLRYVPGGTYLLKVKSASDMRHGPGGLPCPLGCKEIREYASTALPLTLKTDRSGLVLEVVGAATDRSGGAPREPQR